ncbi:MAG: alanine--tRNA ligase [bacterium]|nr:alanine--tRNA ligase [bacterium]MDZ4284497.1 alanine--tRNA ligase [Patescibacteria group bacterium]
MQTAAVRKRYLEFFEKRGHTLIPSGLLVPENDPTTLFTGSGMQPLLPYLLGEPHPAGKRLVNSQKCFRAEDIDEVGDNRHTTFFEMLGNWSLGDYFKTEQLQWFFEFLTDGEHGIGLDPSRLYVTVFGGDTESGIRRDDEAAEIWQKLFREKGIDAAIAEIGSEKAGSERGIRPGERIFYYGAKKNWWSRMGDPAKMPAGEPGGPDSEMFFDFDPSGAMHDKRFGENCHPNCDCGRFMEIGNSVFMQYRKRADGGFDELPQKNVDFGGGLERMTAATGGDPDVFRIDTLRALIDGIEARMEARYGGNEQLTLSFRVVADHLRGAVFMIADGILPANKEQGYFVRRLLRRAVRHMDLLGMQENTLHELVPLVAEHYADKYPVLVEQTRDIREEIQKEEEKFRLTLARGLKEFERMSAEGPSGTAAFDLYQTYGFPFEMTLELAHEKGFTIDREEFEAQFRSHQDASRAGAEKKFHGGLADHSAMSVRYHTATHLLHQALRDVLGEHVFQKGSNITPERLRFDFVHPRKMTREELERVERAVNERIAADLPVAFEILPLEEAKRRGAIGLFEDQYGEKVKVYKIGEGASRADGLYSFEFCGGPHVGNTRELGEGGTRFKIIKEEAISSGIRRIRAVLAEV